MHPASPWSVQLVLTCLTDSLPVVGSQSGRGWQPLCAFGGTMAQKQWSYSHFCDGTLWPVLDMKDSQNCLPDGWQNLPPHWHLARGQVSSE